MRSLPLISASRVAGLADLLDRAGIPADRCLEAAKIACPVLLIRGQESRLLSAEGAGELVAELPSARWIEIAGAGQSD